MSDEMTRRAGNLAFLLMVACTVAALACSVYGGYLLSVWLTWQQLLEFWLLWLASAVLWAIIRWLRPIVAAAYPD